MDIAPTRPEMGRYVLGLGLLLIIGGCGRIGFDPMDDRSDPPIDEALGWSRHFAETSGSAHGHGVAVDVDDNIYVVGHFPHTIDLGGTTYTSAGNDDAFVASYGIDGEIRWSRSFGGGGDDEALAIEVGPDGNVYVAGFFSGSMSLGPTLTSAGGTDAYVASLTSSGHLRWSLSFGGSGDDMANAIAVDSLDSTYVAGFFHGDLGVVGAEPTPGSGSDAFAAHVTDAGPQWAIAGRSPEATCAGIALTDNELRINGKFRGSISFGAGEVESSGDWDVFVASLSFDAVPQWVRGFGDSGVDVASGLAADSAGNVYWTGRFTQTLSLGVTQMASAGRQDAYLASLDRAGEPVFARAFGGGDDDSGLALAVDRFDRVHVSGVVRDTVDLAGEVLPAAGSGDVFVTTFGATGLALWANRFGGPSFDESFAIAATADGGSVVLGQFQGTTDFGDGPHTAGGNADVFVLRLVPTF